MFMLIEKSVIIEHKLPIKEHSRLKIYLWFSISNSHGL